MIYSVQFSPSFIILENTYSSNSDDDPTYYPSDSSENLPCQNNLLEDCDDLYPRSISREQLPQINNTVSVSHIINIVL